MKEEQNNSDTSALTLALIPNEIILQILLRLDVKAITALMLASIRFYNYIAHDNRLWHVICAANRFNVSLNGRFEPALNYRTLFFQPAYELLHQGELSGNAGVARYKLSPFRNECRNVTSISLKGWYEHYNEVNRKTPK